MTERPNVFPAGPSFTHVSCNFSFLKNCVNLIGYTLNFITISDIRCSMAVEFQVLDHISTFTTLRLITGKALRGSYIIGYMFVLREPESLNTRSY